MTTPLRILFCTGIGWLAGEAGARFFLSAPGHNGISNAKSSKNQAAEFSQENEWATLLKRRGGNEVTGITADELTTLLARNGRDGLPMLPRDSASRLELSRRLSKIPASEFPDMLPAILSGGSPSTRRQLARHFFAAWARYDPLGAIEGIKQAPVFGEVALTAVMMTWAESDPRGMLGWTKTPGNAEWARLQAEAKVFGVLAGRDPEEAMELAKEFSAYGSEGQVFRAWYARDPEAADRWMASTATKEERKAVFEDWIDTRMEKDPPAAWDLTLTQHPDPKHIPDVLSGVFFTWQKKDAAAAYEALQNAPGDVWRPGFASVIGENLGGKSTPGLEELAERIPEEKARGAFWSAVVEYSANENPVYAAAAFMHIPADAEDRPEYAEQIVENWAEKDAPAASEWVRSLPRDVARDTAAAALVDALSEGDPEAARKWAADIGDEKIRKEALENLEAALGN